MKLHSHSTPHERFQVSLDIDGVIAQLVPFARCPKHDF